MEGTLSIIVNLRSASVEYSREKYGDGRFSHVMRGDEMSAKDIIALPGFENMPFDSDESRLAFVTKELIKSAKSGIASEGLSITRAGNDVTIHPDDISFITFVKTGIFLEI